MVDTFHVQGRHGCAMLNSLLDEKAPRRCAERLGKNRQRVFQSQEDFLEVFFTAANSWGRERLIAGSPIRAR